MTIKGNILIGQSGGPTAVINSSLYGIIDEAKKIGYIDKIYGAIYGIEGVLNNNLIDLNKEDDNVIEGLKWTPGAALGGCRYKLSSKIVEQHNEIKKIFDVFEKYNIRYFFYIGGNDSMDTADKINNIAKKMGYELNVIGVPKTVDNDLVLTHHCPGYGSTAKYVATSVMEAGLHTASMYTSEPVTILETVGRNTGWLPAASALASNNKIDAPHLIYFPEISFNIDRFLEDVENTYKEVGGVFIVVGEGLKDEKGDYINVQEDEVAIDAFGHPMLGGNSEYLKNIIEKNLKLKSRYIKLDICQQSAMHFASQRDVDDAILVGRAAVQAAINGKSGYMVTLKESKTETGLAELKDIANQEREVPRQWINEEGNYVTEEFLDYVRPLIQGEVKVPLVNGLPEYIRLNKVKVE